MGQCPGCRLRGSRTALLSLPTRATTPTASARISVARARSPTSRTDPTAIGGDNLEPLETGCNVEGAGTVKAKGLVIRQFGYAVWDREGKDWRGSLFKADGKITTRCRLQSGSLRSIVRREGIPCTSDELCERQSSSRPPCYDLRVREGVA